MILLLLAPFGAAAVMVSCPGAASAGHRPSLVAPMVTIWMITVAVCTTGSVGLAAWPLIARLGVVARIGGWRPGDVGRVSDLPLAVSAVAVCLLAAIAVRLFKLVVHLGWQARGLASAHRALASVAVGSVCIVDDSAPMAYAAPSFTVRGGRAVISSGLIEVLDHEERHAVLAHEDAHLRHRHHLFVIAIDAAVAVNPMLSRGGQLGRLELERWADDDASATTSKTVLASALAKTGLAELAHRRERRRIALLLRAGSSDVTERVRALLLDTPARRRPAMLRFVVVTTVLGAAAVAFAAADTESAFEMIRHL